MSRAVRHRKYRLTPNDIVRDEYLFIQLTVYLDRCLRRPEQPIRSNKRYAQCIDRKTMFRGEHIVVNRIMSPACIKRARVCKKRLRLQSNQLFKYSPRPGTTADKRLEDTVPLEIKKQRNYKLLEVQEKISDRLSKKFLGQTVKVLVEGPSKKPHLNLAEDENYPQLVARTATDFLEITASPSLIDALIKYTLEATDSPPQSF